MKSLVQWGLGTVLAGVIIGTAIMPEGEDGRGEFRGQTKEDSLYRAWDHERRTYGVMISVVQRGEALADARALPAARPDVPLIRVDPALGDGIARIIEKRVTDELTGARALPTRHPIAVTAILDTAGRGSIYSQSVVLPEKPGDACTVVLRVPSPTRSKFMAVSTQRMLGTCAFYAAYGTPSEATSRWLRETRGVSAKYLVRPPALSDDTAQFRLGVSYSSWSPLVESLLRCRMEIAEACLAFVGPESSELSYFDFNFSAPIDRSPLRTEFPGVQVNNSGSWSNDAVRLRSGMLGTLATEMGPERFGAIWRDSRGLQDAYQSSTGKSFASFVGEQVARRTFPYAAGPAIPGLSFVLAVAIVGLLGIWAISRSPREML